MTIVFLEYDLRKVLDFRYRIIKVYVCHHLFDRLAIETQIVGIYATKDHEFSFLLHSLSRDFHDRMFSNSLVVFVYHGMNLRITIRRLPTTDGK